MTQSGKGHVRHAWLLVYRILAEITFSVKKKNKAIHCVSTLLPWEITAGRLKRKGAYLNHLVTYIICLSPILNAIPTKLL